jgi:hypothetical protein
MAASLRVATFYALPGNLPKTVNAGKTEMHFEGHPTGVDVQQLVLHGVDTIRDATSGRAQTEKDRVLP